MIIGIGIDLVEVGRFKRLLKRRSSLTRIFTAKEIRYCERRKYPAESFAARFAAKEAFLKAIGTGWGTRFSPKLQEIEVIDENKKPSLKLSDKAKEIAKKHRIKDSHLSLTHTTKYALAILILTS
jgi:holo-[acyl-carrier protein] synthase